MIPYVLQLLGVGFIWVSFHCIGMCGPIVAGLNAAHCDPSEESNWLRAGTLNILTYQAGRSLTYAGLGATAGWVGASLDGAISGVGNIVALVAGAVLAGVGLARVAGIPLSFADTANQSESVGGRLGRAARRLTRLVGNRGRLKFAVFGAVMGFLPCMLMFWVLGLAASTGSPLGGVGVMLGLVAMTTPVLIFAGNAPLAAGSSLQRYGETIAAVALVVSGLWLLLIGAAANGWVEHLAYSVETQWGTLKFMFW